jgi:adenine-specific DNA-methyltransferase
VAGWKPADLLVEVMLLEGWPLDSTQTHSPDFIDNTVTIIEHPSLPAKLLVCLDEEIYDSTVEQLADYSKNVFVCLEAALVDAVKVRIADVKDLRVKTL